MEVLMINIFEALFILALDDEEGDIVESVEPILESALAGAVLAELALQNRLELVEDRVVIKDQTPAHHSILDKALFDMIDAAKPRKLRYWINTLTYKKLMEEIGQTLVENEVLFRRKKRLHLAVPYGGSSGGNISAKYTVKNRLREIVLAGQPPELSERVLLAFLHRSELLKLVFTHGERKAAYKRVKKMIENEEKESLLGEPLEKIVAVACPF
jgi:Golgi phosphoprotein 3